MEFGIETKYDRIMKIKEFFKDKEEFFNCLKQDEDFDCGDYCDYSFYYRDNKSLICLSIEYDGTMHFNYQSLEFELPEHNMCCLNYEDSTNIINIFYMYLKKFVVIL